MKFQITSSFLLAGFALFLSGEPNDKHESLPSDLRFNGGLITKLLGKNKDEILESSVGLFRNDKLIAQGILVDSSGYILSKASSSVGAKRIKTSKDQTFPIRVRKRDERTDLALWQVLGSPKKWEAVHWADLNQSTELGTWSASPGSELDDVKLGVISANSRIILREGGVMGVLLEDLNMSTSGISITEVLPHSSGDRAGLIIGDKILKIDGRVMKSTDQINQLMQNKDPGDLLTLRVNRKHKEVDIRITLGHRSVGFDLFNRNLLMSGPVSKRRDHFPFVIQNDLPLEKELMGGGLFSLQGKCIGINIARVDRVSNYTLPYPIILPVLEAWFAELF
jgi:S1-C subfamily serine protease